MLCAKKVILWFWIETRYLSCLIWYHYITGSDFTLVHCTKPKKNINSKNNNNKKNSNPQKNTLSWAFLKKTLWFFQTWLRLTLIYLDSKHISKMVAMSCRLSSVQKQNISLTDKKTRKLLQWTRKKNIFINNNKCSLNSYHPRPPPNIPCITLLSW